MQCFPFNCIDDGWQGVMMTVVFKCTWTFMCSGSGASKIWFFFYKEVHNFVKGICIVLELSYCSGIWTSSKDIWVTPKDLERTVFWVLQQWISRILFKPETTVAIQVQVIGIPRNKWMFSAVTLITSCCLSQTLFQRETLQWIYYPSSNFWLKYHVYIIW